MKKKRTGPGRPEGESFARERILAAAEIEFADHGYAGSSVRQIVRRAHVTQALVSYYFGSKEALFKEVFLRRGMEIARARLDGLTALPKRPTLEQVIATYLRPALDMRRTRGGRAFIRLQARMHTEPSRFAESLRRQVYDDTVRRYVASIQEAVPHLSARTAYWRMVFMIGAYLYAHSDAHRLEALSKKRARTDDVDEMLQQITTFVVGGMMAANPDGPRKPKANTRSL